MSEAQKDTIYIDVDDDITTIIERVKTAKHKIVALVLPKRATVLQSVVNMKLLKRSADSSKKNLVLITSEAGLMPLAGAVGLHVAKNLQSKPAIPSGPDTSDLPESLIKEEEIEAPETDPQVDAAKSIGELAGDETIELDNTAETTSKPAKKTTANKDKKLKVPNFERFRKWFIIGGIALVVLLVGGYFMLAALPKAHITIDANASTQNANLSFTADTTNRQFNKQTNTVPAEKQEVKKTDTQTVPATGQRNDGTKASGSVSMSVRRCSGSTAPPQSVPAGTGLSANGLTYITQSGANFGPGELDDGCVIFTANSTNIVAQNGGANYNTNNTTFTVSGRADVTAQGSANGGTDNIVKIVSQADVDNAKAKVNTAGNEQAARDELTKNLEKNNMFPLKESFTTQGPDVTSNPAVGSQGDNVTVTSITTYSMLGFNQGDLAKLVTAQVNNQIDTDQQAVINDGLSSATYTIQDGSANPKIAVQTTVTIGPKLDMEALKQEIAGKKKGQTVQIIQSRPDIRDVTVDYSPFWVGSTPKKISRITIVFNEASDNDAQ